MHILAEFYLSCVMFWVSLQKKIGLGIKYYFLMLILSCFKCQFYWIFLHLFSDIVVFRALVWILKLDRRRINGTVSILAVIWPSNVIVVNDRSGRTQHGIAGPTLVLVQSGKLFMVSAALEEPHYFSSQILLKKNPK